MKETFQFLKELNINGKVIAAISGGPDSMVLLSLLCKLKKETNIEIVCAHVNHKIRKESDDEIIMVQNYCELNNLIFESKTLNNEAYYNEAYYHHVRYQFFYELMGKYNSEYLFTAHHGDDLMETILMRIARGSTLKGYSGFQRISIQRNYKVVRPLIKLTKNEIIEYADKNDIPYAVDQTNFSDKYTRNRFRNHIIPLLKKEDKNIHLKFYKFSQMLIESNNYIDREVKQKIGKIYINNELNIELILKEEELIQRKIINKLLEDFYKDDLNLITDSHSDLLYELIHSKKANILIHLPNNTRAIKSYNKLRLINNEENINDYEIEMKKTTLLPNGKTLEFIKETDDNSNFVCKLNSQEIKLPLYVRNRKEGDKMEVKGLSGRKKIKDIFIDEKVLSKERVLWPIVLDSNDNIVWIPGLKKSKFDKLKNEKYDIIVKYY